jgi:hypothetical protein
MNQANSNVPTSRNLLIDAAAVAPLIPPRRWPGA